MFILHEIKLDIREPEEMLAAKAAARLGLPAGSVRVDRIVKESLDAREKPHIFRVFSLALSCEKRGENAGGRPDGSSHGPSDGEKTLIAAAKRRRLKYTVEEDEPFDIGKPGREFKKRPVVCGFGPCGMFAALVLAEYGAKPVVLERGACMEKRMKAVETFWNGGPLDPVANVQFGEGGAGSFSDGKLTTGTKDPSQRWILKTLADAGAPADILYRHHPHIGTDLLRGVVVNIRKKIIGLGGTFMFETKLIRPEIKDGRICGVHAEDLAEGRKIFIETDTLILAVGHSARDTVRTLHAQGIHMEPKPFSMGVRIEHPQALIDEAQYGAPHQELGLPVAEYKLNCRTSSGRGVYTFCMCPGGYVVASASENGGLVTNGMSNRARDGENANSALLVDVRPDDFPDQSDPLSGMELQEKYEKLAFELGGSSYAAPAEYVSGFLGGGSENAETEYPAPEHSTETGAPGTSLHAVQSDLLEKYGPVQPTYKPGIRLCGISECLPDYVSASLKEALPVLDRRLRGFAYPGALLTAIESRSSAPYRIRRSADCLALSGDGTPITGFYPGGEGAGYAGGIMSAAADGVRLAMKAAEHR